MESSEFYGLLKSFEAHKVDEIVKELMSQGYIYEKLTKVGKYSIVFLEVKKSKLYDLINPHKKTDPISIKLT